MSETKRDMQIKFVRNLIWKKGMVIPDFNQNDAVGRQEAAAWLVDQLDGLTTEQQQT